MILNVYAPNNRESTQKPKKLKEEIDKFTIIFGTSVPHYWQLQLTKQWTSKDRELIHWHDLTDIYRTFPCYNTRIHVLSKSYLITKVSYILSHKTDLNQLKRTEIMQTMFSDHKGIKLEINNRKIKNIWNVNNTFLNKPWVKEEVSLKILKMHRI